MSYDFQYERSRMVEDQLIPRGISSAAVLHAMHTVPRHMFVPPATQGAAYFDAPIQIGLGQTISQPYIVAYMTEQLDPAPGMKILEIGTGSGYQAAILSFLECNVYTIEILEEHADNAKRIFAELGYDRIVAKQGNGYAGWVEEAPFDAIIVTAAPEHIPIELTNQLVDGGKMIVPVGKNHSVQSLLLLTKTDGEIKSDELLSVRFVPMVEDMY